MPIARTPYVPLPAVIPRRVADTRTLGDLLRRQGEGALQYQLQRGQNAAQLWQQLGQVFSNYSQGRRSDADQAAAAELRKQEKEAADQLKRDELAQRRAEREEAARIRKEAEDRQKRLDAEKRGEAVAEEVGYGPMSEPQLDAVMDSPAAGRARYVFGPGTAEGPELQPTQAQKRQIAIDAATRAAAEAAAKDREEDNRRQAARDAEALRHNRVVEARTGAAQEPLVAIMGDDGAPVLVPRSQAAGRRPASTREQGRAVTSGDAGRLADLDTSLDDLVTLASTLQETKGATGVAAQVGAALWNPITNLTGWGTDAKKRQGVIDRVKQVIGKALEGGVLRKEDEIKYAKILPAIADDPEVATSKLEGLRTALIQRRQTLLDSLGDAGYDTSKFAERGVPTGGNVQAVPDLGGIREGFSRTFRSGPFAGQEWATVNGQPKRVK